MQPNINTFVEYRFVDTNIIPPPFKAKMIEGRMEFAEVGDAVKAVLKVATDETVNGKVFPCLKPWQLVLM